VTKRSIPNDKKNSYVILHFHQRIWTF
jgi:hypothetical protein